VLRKLEKYEILEEIGHGGMATVYRARDSRLDRFVAVKVMHPHLRGAGEARARFVREARTVARIKHPNILEIHDNSEETSEESYIVTELLTGPTLKVFAEKHEIPAEIAACFAIEICRALGAAHRASIVHRDVKPENVLLHEDRCAKLTDFGIAQMVDTQSFTATGQILGSPGHMAPEQVEGGECDSRTDLFQLGTVLYYLATGQLPFIGRNPHQILKRIVDGDYPDPLRVRPAIGGHLRRIIVRAMSSEPSQRYQDADSLEADLLAFAREAGIENPSEMLTRYLKDPASVSTQLRTALIERLTILGERAARAGQVPIALDYFNRVLVFDEANKKVLVLIERVGRRARLHSFIVSMGALLGVLGLSALVYAAVVASGGSPEISNTPSTHRDVHAIVQEELDGSRADVAEAGMAVAAGDARLDGSSRPDTRSATIAVAPPTGPRLVVFHPEPQNVSISVDGAPPRDFGPSFQQIRLDPGRHIFRAVGAAGCCEDREIVARIPPGAEPFPISFTLRFRPAVLNVITPSVVGDVVVDDGRVRGRTNSLLSIQTDRLEPQVSYTVTADGYRAYTGTVRLRAGHVQQVRVTLDRASVGGGGSNSASGEGP